MGVVLEEAEGDAAWILRSFDRRLAPGARSIARDYFKRDVVVEAPWLKVPAKATFDVAGNPVILVRPGLPSAVFRWNLVHEVVEHHVRATHLGDELVEDYCELTTACVVVPREALIYRVRQVGLDWARLAAGFNTTETCVALRYLEVFGVPGAVDSRATKIRARGPERAWQVAETIRSISSGRLIVPGVRKVQLTDPRRVLLTEENVIDVA